MAVSDTVFITVIGVFFNYLVVYQKNKFLGNIIYILISGLVLYTGSQFTQAKDINTVTAIGAIMLAASIISMIYDLLNN